MTQRINPTTGREYWDQFDPVKMYHQILFNCGVDLQQQELNEFLTLVLYKIQRLGQTLFNDGSIVRGGALVIKGTEITIPATDIFVAGVIHSLPDTVINITGTGTEVLGVKLEETIIQSSTDPDLLDPAGGENFGLPGADRLKVDPTWVLDDVTAYPIYIFIDGQLKIEKSTFESDSIAGWLARRTNDESGSYTVSGLTGSVIEKDTDNLTLINEAGTGYVLGWEIRRPSPIKTDFPKAKTVQTVTNETKTYTTGVDLYTLNSQPVKQINQLTAQVSATFQMTRGSTPNTMDAIPAQYTPVSSITSITGYVSPADYVLNGNNVDWSPGGSEPGSGASYQITLVYTKVMILDTDYELYDDNGTDKVHFLAGDRPINGSNFQTTYEFYLERRDIFYLTKDGEIKILQGTPSVIAPMPPFPVGVLILGDMYIPPNSSTVIVTNYDPKRLTMAEIRRLRERMDDLEYNQALEDLDNAATVMEPATTKLGIFTDGFLNMDKMDTAYAGFGCSIDPDQNKMMAKFTATSIDPVSNGTGTAYRFNQYATKPFTEIVKSQQDKATRKMRVNPYQVYTNTALIRVTPNQDNWVITETIISNVFNWWNHWNGRWSELHPSSILTRILLDELIIFIRLRTLTITGRRFSANADNIQCTFDGTLVSLTPTGSTVAGTDPGTVRSNANGEFTATFTIPANKRTGTREIVAWNEV